jgi:hypothetical protein
MDNHSPDSVCASFADCADKITIRTLEEGEVLIEGSAAALEFLGSLLVAQAHYRQDCGFHISPSGAGSALFSPSSTLGVYIHRKPCAHGDAETPAA